MGLLDGAVTVVNRAVTAVDHYKTGGKNENRGAEGLMIPAKSNGGGVIISTDSDGSGDSRAIDVDAT